MILGPAASTNVLITSSGVEENSHLQNFGKVTLAPRLSDELMKHLTQTRSSRDREENINKFTFNLPLKSLKRFHATNFRARKLKHSQNANKKK